MSEENQTMELKFNVNLRGLVEVSVALGQAIAIMESQTDGNPGAYYRTQLCLRHLLTEIHKQLDERREYSASQSFGKDKQLFF